MNLKEVKLICKKNLR